MIFHDCRNLRFTFFCPFIFIFFLIIGNIILYELDYLLASTFVMVTLIFFMILLIILMYSLIKYNEMQSNYEANNMEDDIVINLHFFPMTSNKDEDCVICLEPLDSAIILNCNHVYHRSCIEQLFKYKFYTCPLCRSTILSE